MHSNTSDSTIYQPLSSEYGVTPGDGQWRSRCFPHSRLWLWCIIIIQTTVLTAVVTLGRDSPPQRDHYLYSPAEEAVSYRFVRFFDNAHMDAPRFQDPPSAELDARWEGLYGFGISRIPRSQAIRLPNRTEAMPGDEEFYIAELDVFHQLHCLNLIRKALYPAHYPNMNMNDETIEAHVSHCIDSIRQSLMCAADISVNVWQWNHTEMESFPKFDVLHRCRDFDKIKEWALQRMTIVKFNSTRHVGAKIPKSGH